MIDKDFASELLARELNADLFVMLTDAEAVYVDWGKPTQKAIRRASPTELQTLSFAAGSMGPKVAGRLPVRGGDRQECGHWRVGRPEPDHRRRGWHDGVGKEYGIVYAVT